MDNESGPIGEALCGLEPHWWPADTGSPWWRFDYRRFRSRLCEVGLLTERLPSKLLGYKKTEDGRFVCDTEMYDFVRFVCRGMTHGRDMGSIVREAYAKQMYHGAQGEHRDTMSYLSVCARRIWWNYPYYVGLYNPKGVFEKLWDETEDLDLLEIETERAQDEFSGWGT